MHKPLVQGTSEQQSLLTSHCCPYTAQVVSSGSPPVPPSAEPPLPPAGSPEPPAPPAPPTPPEPGGSTALHVPRVVPTSITHSEPRQQSPEIVHEPPAGTQLSLLQRSTPLLSAVHGRSSQQSSLDAQVSPLLRHSSPKPLQRGTPNLSS